MGFLLFLFCILNNYNVEKLTYYQICNLIQQGREDEIPSGYNITWMSPKPQKLFDVEIPGERITVNGNDFPSPTKAYASGEYKVIIPIYIVLRINFLILGMFFYTQIFHCQNLNLNMNTNVIFRFG